MLKVLYWGTLAVLLYLAALLGVQGGSAGGDPSLGPQPTATPTWTATPTQATAEATAITCSNPWPCETPTERP